VNRAALEQQALDRLASPAPGAAPFVVVAGARGLGKTRLLERTAARLATRGVIPVVADVDRIGASPEELARHLVRRVDRAAGLAGHPPFPAESGPAALARTIEAQLAAPRPAAATLLEGALSYPRAVADRLGRPLPLVLDELGEITGLSRHAGLRGLEGLVARALAGPAGPPVLASVSPASRPGSLLKRCEEEAAAAGRPFLVLPIAPWSHEEMAEFLSHRGGQPPAPGVVGAWLRATGGRPLYAEILARRCLGPGRTWGLAEALAAEMGDDGTLRRECRFDYHMLVERSRGKAVVRSILSLVAASRRVNLTAVARHAHTALPTATDYLAWMIEVGLLQREVRTYRLADPLLGMWLRLNGPEEADPLEEAVRLLEDAPGASPGGPSSSILLPPAPPSAPARGRGGDFPMEID
jgi:hypothetical protein